MTRFLHSTLATLLFAATAPLLLAADWPHWLGPNSNGSSPETGLRTTFPAEGPKVLWRVPGGGGYSSVAVANGRAFTLVQRDNDELVVALDAASGKELWTHRLGPAYKNANGSGPRSTPTIEGARVYVQSVTGPLACLEFDSGKVVWEHDLLKEFAAKNISWGLCASPVIEGKLVLALPGGKGAGVAAFNKEDGKLVWKTGDDKAAYASPVVLTVDGKRQAVFFTAVGLLGVRLDDGKELWRLAWKTEFDCNICTPLVIGDQIFVSSGEKVGCALLKVRSEGPPEVVWESKGVKCVLTNYWANSVVHGKHLYGFSGEFDGVVDLVCVELATGKRVWVKERFGLGSLTLADGHLYITDKPGSLVVVEATPEAYRETARAKKVLTQIEYATSPTIAGGRLYLRDLKDIVAVDLGK
jgi:outer membrane protein assembly factor BamB